MALREVVVELGVDVDRRGEQKAEGMFSRLKKGIGGLVSAGNVLTATLTTGVVGTGLFKLVEAASDVTEQLNVMTSVFGDEVSPEIEKFASRFATATGQSSNEIRKLATNIGSLISPTLRSTKASAQFSKATAQLVFDLASFENLRVEDSLEKIRAGLIGSSEPLQSVGIDTRIATLEQFRLSKGLKTAVKDMDQATKSALTLAFITERLASKRATGDAIKTSEGFANALRGLRGNLKQASAEIGAALLPTAGKLVVTFNKLVQGSLPNLKEQTIGVIDTIKGFASSAMNLWRTTVTALTPAFNRLGVGLAKLFGTFNELKGGAFSLGKDALPLLSKIFDKVVIGVDFLINKLSDLIDMWIGLDDSTKLAIKSAAAVFIGLKSLELLAKTDTFSFLKPFSDLLNIMDWVRFGLNTLGKAFTFVGRLIGNIFAKVTGKILAKLVFMSTKAKLAVGAVVAAILFLPKEASAAVGEAADTFSDKFIEAFMTVKRAFFSIFKSVFDFTDNLFGGAIGKFVLSQFGGTPDERVVNGAQQFAQTTATDGVPRFLRSPNDRNTSIVNSPVNDISVTVNAQTGASAEDISSAAGKQIKDILDQNNRETMQSFLVGAPS